MANQNVSRSTHRFQWRRIDWVVVFSIGSMHLVALALAPFFFSWSALIVMVALAWMTGALGITLGFHRLLTHRSFRTPKVIEYLLTTFGCLALQGPPTQWVGTHRLHHAESDTELDPHSPRDGFTWAHMLWCMIREEKAGSARAAAGDLVRDPFMRLLDRFFWVPAVLLGVGLFLVGGWSWLIWGLCVRTVVVYHTTWFVNSAAHTWGYRNYNTTDASRNTWWVALLSFGEGWHNNHHAFQRSAAHGLRWWEIDMTYWMILVMGWCGLAQDIVKPASFLHTSRAERLTHAAAAPVNRDGSVGASVLSLIQGQTEPGA